MDENWLAFGADRGLKLWDCHYEKFYELPVSNVDALSSMSFLESRPGEIPVVVSLSFTNSRSLQVNSRSAEKIIPNVAEPLRGGCNVQAIDNRRVIVSGGAFDT